MARTVLDRLPPLATTGVGSLPFVEAGPAARHAVRAYDVPFCPQLPALDGDMIREWLGPDARRCGWTADRDRERPVAWDAFLAELRVRPPAHRTVKLQVTGPVTLAIALEREAGRLGVGSALLGLAREIAGWVAANAGGQIRVLRDAGFTVLLTVDEPGLAYAGLRPAHADVWDPLRATGAGAWGMHVCGAVPWPLVHAARPDVVSFDASRYGLDATGRATLTALVRGGVRVAWGVVDPTEPGGAGPAAGRAAACIAALAGGDWSPEDVAARSLLTPGCGTGRLSATREHLVAAVLAASATATTGALAAFPIPEPDPASLLPRKAR